MTGVPKQDASPNRQGEFQKHKLDTEKQLIGKTLEQLSRVEDEKHKKIEQQAQTQVEELKQFQQYIQREVKDITDMKRFLATLKEQIKL